MIKEEKNTQRGGKWSWSLKATAQNTKCIIPYDNTSFDDNDILDIAYLKQFIPSPIGFPKLDTDLSIGGMIDPSYLEKISRTGYFQKIYE